jgi:hypothetical protein
VALAAEQQRTIASYATRIAQTLITASAAFATSNEPLPREVLATNMMDQPSLQRPYKALVIFYFDGGADTFNLLMPHSNCDARNLTTQYVNTRTNAGYNLATVLPINVPPGSQPCNTFGVHPNMPTLQRLFNEGDASFTANVGSLIVPMTKTEYVNKLKVSPPQLFAHKPLFRFFEEAPRCEPDTVSLVRQFPYCSSIFLQLLNRRWSGLGVYLWIDLDLDFFTDVRQLDILLRETIFHHN